MGDNAIGRNIVLCIKHFTARKITILRTTVLLLYVLTLNISIAIMALFISYSAPLAAALVQKIFT